MPAILNETSAGLVTTPAAQNGIAAIARLVAVAQQPQQTNDPAARADLANQFNGILSQIDWAAQKANSGGSHLLNGGSLEVQISGDIITVPGVADTATGLRIAPATKAWVSTTDVVTAAMSLNAAAPSSLQTMTSFMAGAVCTMQSGTTVAASLKVPATAEQSTTLTPTYSLGGAL